MTNTHTHTHTHNLQFQGWFVPISLRLVLGIIAVYGMANQVHVVKNLPANAGDARDVGLILGQEDPQEMATRSSVLACGIPRTEDPGGL